MPYSTSRLISTTCKYLYSRTRTRTRTKTTASKEAYKYSVPRYAERLKYCSENMDKYTVQFECRPTSSTSTSSRNKNESSASSSSGEKETQNHMIISMPPLTLPSSINKHGKTSTKRKITPSATSPNSNVGSDSEKTSAPTSTSTSTSTTESATEISIPESVLQYERQMRKAQAAKRASTPLSPSKLQIIHDDTQMVVVNKPSGVLTVPGINSNPSMLSLLYEIYKNELNTNTNENANENDGTTSTSSHDEMKMEHMITHRLDMDTSGIVLFAKTKECMSHIQAAFRDKQVTKSYEALVCGHIPQHIHSGSIDLPLQRDHRFPPFMRVATPTSERKAKEVVKDLQTAGLRKLVKKNPKPSQTLFEVVKREYVHVDGSRHGHRNKMKEDEDKGNNDDDDDDDDDDQNQKEQEMQKIPVTRIRLTPITGRTHQLRVHCAAMGHPIVGDPTYGILCEASPNGGFDDSVMDEMMPTRASTKLQLDIDQWAKDVGQCMCLHAKELQVKHPTSGENMVFEQAPTF